MSTVDAVHRHGRVHCAGPSATRPCARVVEKCVSLMIPGGVTKIVNFILRELTGAGNQNMYVYIKISMHIMLHV